MILLVACNSSRAPQPEQKNEVMGKSTDNSINVQIKGFKFVPVDIIVKAGDTVTWTNEDSAPHTVEDSDKILSSDELSKGDAYSFTFTKPGKYGYICGIHPSMKGSVMVQ